MKLQPVWWCVINFESNETLWALQLKNLLNYETLKMEFEKKPFSRKWLFKMLIIYFTIWNYVLQQIFILKQCAFVQEWKLLSNIAVMLYKSSDFFHQNQWKSESWIFWPYFQKVAITRFSGPTKWDLLPDNVTYMKLFKTAAVIGILTRALFSLACKKKN